MTKDIDIQKIISIAKDAGEAILEVYAQDFEVLKKEDHSPITLADKEANDIITNELKKAYPEIPIISEESKQTPYEIRKDWEYFWLVDPLDGTKEFINKNGEFTVNIALVHFSEPILGVVYVPVTGVTYYASKDEGAFKLLHDGTVKKLNNSVEHYSNKKEVKVVASRSHLTEDVKRFVDELKNEGKVVQFISSGSSLKFCLVAEGVADVYPRFSPTMEWDTAAAQIVATASGRKVQQLENQKPVVYNKENLLNPWFIVE